MGITDAERNIELLRQLAESRESNATLQRILERQSYQIERMNDQMERALRELAMLRRQLNKPPPDEPPPGTAAVPPGPVEVPEAPPRPARPPKKMTSRYGRSELPKNLERVVDAREPGACAKCGGTNAKIRHLGQYLPRDPLTRALNYLHNHRDALMRFLTNGQIPLDNNLAERQLRAVAVGRKNYLFAGSDGAARRSAIFHTCIATCRQHGVAPVAWITDVLPRIETTGRDRLAELLPQNWTMTAVETRAAAQPAPSRGVGRGSLSRRSGWT